MHTKRYRKLTQQLCEEAVEECFKGKWRRNDVLTFIEKYAGISRIDIKIDDLSGSKRYKNEAVEAIGIMLLGTVEDLIEYGIEPEDMVPVVIRKRPDGMTGKVRDIALLCIMHQLLGHVEKADAGTVIQCAIASDAARKYTTQGTDAAEGSGATLLPEGITGNQLFPEDGRGTRLSNIDV